MLNQYGLPRHDVDTPQPLIQMSQQDMERVLSSLPEPPVLGGYGQPPDESWRDLQCNNCGNIVHSSLLHEFSNSWNHLLMLWTRGPYFIALQSRVLLPRCLLQLIWLTQHIHHQPQYSPLLLPLYP